MLCIGNSFSVDATEKYLLPLMNEAGEQIEIINLYRAAASLYDALQSVRTDTILYEAHYPVSPGKVRVRKGVSLLEMLREDSYDIVTLQQCSELSGRYGLYQYLRNLIPEIKYRQSNAEIYFHQTWAYAQWFEGSGFRSYNYSMGEMYEAIMECNRQLLEDYPKIDRFIPAGTAIQNGRVTFNNLNQLSRDGCHLDSLGCFVAACAWFETLTDRDVRATHYRPKFLNDEGATLAKECAHAAGIENFKVTKIEKDGISKIANRQYEITNLPGLLIFKPNTANNHHLKVIGLEGRILYEADVNATSIIRVPPGVKIVEIDNSVTRKYLF